MSFPHQGRSLQKARPVHCICTLTPPWGLDPESNAGEDFQGRLTAKASDASVMWSTATQDPPARGHSSSACPRPGDSTLSELSSIVFRRWTGLRGGGGVNRQEGSFERVPTCPPHPHPRGGQGSIVLPQVNGEVGNRRITQGACKRLRRRAAVHFSVPNEELHV